MQRPASHSVPVSIIQESRLSHRAWAESVHRESYFLDDHIAWRLTGELDAASLDRALACVWSRHDALAATYLRAPDGSWQQVLTWDHPPRANRVVFEPFDSASSDSETEAVPARLMDQLVDLVSTPIQLVRAPALDVTLIEVRQNEHVLVIHYPSLMMDHWGVERFCDDLARAYSSLARGEDPDLGACGQFSTYASVERASLEDGKWHESVQYWLDHHRGSSPLPSLSLSGLGDPHAELLEGGYLEGELSAAATAAIRSVTERMSASGITPFCVTLAALVSLLAEIEGERSIGVLVPAANREDWRYHESVGLFATILSLRFREVPAAGFDELCRTVRETLWESLAHQHVSYHAMLRRAEPERFGRPARRASFYFDYWIEQVGEQQSEFDGLESQPLSIPPRHRPEHENLSLVFHESSDGMIGYVFSYARRAMSDQHARLLVRDLERLFCRAAEQLSSATADLVRGAALTAAAST